MNFFILIVAGFFLSFPAVLMADTKTDIGQLYVQAGIYEKEKAYQSAISCYRKIYAMHSASDLHAAAIFRIASLYDHKLNNPPQAARYYTLYLSKYGGREGRRAEIRLKNLKQYQDVDVIIYREYLNIVKNARPDNYAVSMARMSAFIADNSECNFLDEALLWLGNEILEENRSIFKPDKSGPLKKARDIYKRILKDYPGSRHRLVALKNLGDCYRLLKEKKMAHNMYQQVIKEGGRRGKILLEINE
jgi:tetratricopeptide (TPR) repeat protein